MEYQLELKEYKGPLETLLGLVEEKKMEVTLVSLAEVTGDFLTYVAALEEDPRYRMLVADFLVIASKLIFIKSKVLLPNLELSVEEETDMKNLESRLKLYQTLKAAEIHIKERWTAVPAIDAREFLMSSERVFFPPKKMTPAHLLTLIKSVRGELERLYVPVEKIEREVVNLKQKIQEVLKRLTEKPMDFKNLQNGRSRGEIVVLFLAVLHLIKDQMVHATQGGHFSEIVIAKPEKNA